MSEIAVTATGLTCGHCAHAVQNELLALPRVTTAEVHLVPGGVSTIAVVTSGPVDAADLAAALTEAGDYTLVSAEQSGG